MIFVTREVSWIHNSVTYLGPPPLVSEGLEIISVSSFGIRETNNNKWREPFVISQDIFRLLFDYKPGSSVAENVLANIWYIYNI